MPRGVYGGVLVVLVALFGGFVPGLRADEPTTKYKAGENRVTFKSEGEELVGNLCLPANYKDGQKLPLVVVTGSWTTVKEQMAGLYARRLAD